MSQIDKSFLLQGFVMIYTLDMDAKCRVLISTLNPNRSLDCYALMTLSFCHLFRRFSVTMEPHCALKATKHLFKNKAIIIITLMTDLG